MVGRLTFSQGIEIQLIAEADEINGRHGYVVCVYIFSDRPTNIHEGTVIHSRKTPLLCLLYSTEKRSGFNAQHKIDPDRPSAIFYAQKYTSFGCTTQ